MNLVSIIKQPELRQILKNLCSLSAENEIVEFKEAKNLMNSTGVVDSGMSGVILLSKSLLKTTFVVYDNYRYDSLVSMKRR